jgi:hypothetical protein
MHRCQARAFLGRYKNLTKGETLMAGAKHYLGIAAVVLVTIFVYKRVTFLKNLIDGTAA